MEAQPFSVSWWNLAIRIQTPRASEARKRKKPSRLMILKGVTLKEVMPSRARVHIRGKEYLLFPAALSRRS